MGENAKKTWDWHNTVVGVGYQAKGVVRQRVGEEIAPKVLDMRSKAQDPAEKGKTQSVDRTMHREKKKERKENKTKHRRRSNSSDSDEMELPPKKKSGKFNPLLQALSIRLRDNLVDQHSK